MTARVETSDLRPAAAFESLNLQLRYRPTLHGMPIHMTTTVPTTYYLVPSKNLEHVSTYVCLYLSRLTTHSMSTALCRTRTRLRIGPDLHPFGNLACTRHRFCFIYQSLRLRASPIQEQTPSVVCVQWWPASNRSARKPNWLGPGYHVLFQEFRGRPGPPKLSQGLHPHPSSKCLGPQHWACSPGPNTIQCPGFA